MNLETRARGAAQSLRNLTTLEVEERLESLHRSHQRRTAAKVVAALAAVAIGFGVVRLQGQGDDDLRPVAPLERWTLVGGNGTGPNARPLDPVGDEWSVSQAPDGLQTYPDFEAADPATHRFLVRADGLGNAWRVMTPGRALPLLTHFCADGYCSHIVLGPGPDEITVEDRSGNLVVIDPDGPRRNLGPVWWPSSGEGGTDGLSWAPDGDTLAESRFEQRSDEAAMTIALRRVGSPETTTLYRYAEPAPPTYAHDARRNSDGWPDWGTPRALDLQWAPDSERLAFLVLTSPELAIEGAALGDHMYAWRLFLADTGTGEVHQIAESTSCLGRLDRRDREFPGAPIDARRGCAGEDPSLAWTPDGQELTVFWDSMLTVYDLTGKVLESRTVTADGPIVWLD